MPSQSQQVGGETSEQRLVVVAFSSPTLALQKGRCDQTP